MGNENNAPETTGTDAVAAALAADNAAFLAGDPTPEPKAKAKGKGKAKPKGKGKEAKEATVPCACGCGEQAKRTFRQGHDQRLLGLLQRVRKGHADARDTARARKQSQHPKVKASEKFTEWLVS
jgi:hypothetical protein